MATTKIHGEKQVQDGTIKNAQVHASAAIAFSKLEKTPIAADGSTTVSADIPLNGNKLTGLADPTSAQDAATKAYVDATAQGLDPKASVRVATTANGTFSSAFQNGATVDGVTLATGDRILLKNQSTGSQNGIYTVNASGAPTRATDADSSSEVTAGMYVWVEEGTANADTAWVLTTNATITLGSTSLAFLKFAGAHSGEEWVDKETPSGTINGSNAAFTIANTPVSGSEHVFLNGVLQEGGGEDYSISGTTITFTTAPETNSRLRVSYRK